MNDTVVIPLAGLLIANVALTLLVGILYAMVVNAENRITKLERRLSAARRWHDDPHDAQK